MRPCPFKVTQGFGSDPNRYSILYTHFQTIRYDTIQFIISSNRYDTILYEYDPDLRAKHYFRLKCFRLSEAHWPHGTLRIILPQFFRLNMILHIVRILPPQKLCNNSPRRTFSSPPESNFGHRGPSELTRAPVQLERPGCDTPRYTTTTSVSYRISAFAAATRIVSDQINRYRVQPRSDPQPCIQRWKRYNKLQIPSIYPELLSL